MATFSSLKSNVSQNAAAKITDAESGSFVNQALSQIWYAFEWSHKKADQIVPTVSDITSGTVTVTNGSATVVGVGTSWTSAVVQRWLRVGSGGDLYKITAFTDSTHVTIENPTGGTGYQAATASAQSYTIFQHVFELSADTDKVLMPSRSLPILKTTRSDIDSIDPLRGSTSSTPTLWAPREVSVNNRYQIELWPRPSTAGVVRIPYLKTPPTLVNASDESLIRGDVIEHLASHKALIYLASKFDPQKYLPIADFFWRLYNGGKGDTEGGSLAQAIQQDQERFGMISHVRTSTGSVAVGDDFLVSHDVSGLVGGW